MPATQNGALLGAFFLRCILKRQLTMKHMNRLIPTLALLAVLPLVGIGCKDKTDFVLDQSTEQDTAVVQGSGDCAHDYYPLAPGYSITYRNTAGESQTEYTMVVADAGDEAARMEFSFPPEEEEDEPMSFTQELICSDGNILPQGYLDMSSAFGDVRVSMETDNVEGVLLPQALPVGATWDTSYDLTVTPEEGSFPMAGFGSMTSSLSITNSVLTEESVTVPAGTYDTLKVESVTTTVTEIPGLPSSVPPTETTVTNYQWWAEGVGLVKMENSDGSSVTEAVSVSLP